MEPLVSLLIHLLVLALILVIIGWVAQLVIGSLGGPPHVLTIVRAILALIFLLWLIGVLMGTGPGPFPRAWR